MKRIGGVQVLQETNGFNPVRAVRPGFESFGIGRGVRCWPGTARAGKSRDS